MFVLFGARTGTPRLGGPPRAHDVNRLFIGVVLNGIIKVLIGCFFTLEARPELHPPHRLDWLPGSSAPRPRAPARRRRPQQVPPPGGVGDLAALRGRHRVGPRVEGAVVPPVRVDAVPAGRKGGRKDV